MVGGQTLLVRMLTLTFALSLVADPTQGQAVDTKALERIAKDLRGGRWEYTKVETLVQALMECGEVRAAGWWLEAAGKQLPKWKKKLKRLTVDWKKKSKLKGPVRSLAVKLVSHTEGYARDKNFKAAVEFSSITRAFLSMHPNATLTRKLDRVVKKCQGEGDLNQKPAALERKKRKAEGLTESFVTVMQESLEESLTALGPWGCQEALSGIYGASQILQYLAKDGSHQERLARIKKLCLENDLGFLKPLRIWVAAADDVKIYQSGTLVMTQPGMVRAFEAWRSAGEGEKGATNPGWKRLELGLLPGERLVFVPTPMTISKIPSGIDEGAVMHNVNSVLVLHAMIGDKTAGAGAWRSKLADKVTDIDFSELQSVMVGHKTDLPAGASGGAMGGFTGNQKITKLIQFGKMLRPGFTMTPVWPLIEEWFKDERVKPIYIRHPGRNPVYVFHVPEP